MSIFSNMTFSNECKCEQCMKSIKNDSEKHLKFKQIINLYSSIQSHIDDISYDKIVDATLFTIVRECLKYYNIDCKDYKKYIEYSNGKIDKLMKKDKIVMNECIFQIVYDTIAIFDNT